MGRLQRRIVGREKCRYTASLKWLVAPPEHPLFAWKADCGADCKTDKSACPCLTEKGKRQFEDSTGKSKEAMKNHDGNGRLAAVAYEALEPMLPLALVGTRSSHPAGWPLTAGLDPSAEERSFRNPAGARS